MADSTFCISSIVHLFAEICYRSKMDKYVSRALRLIAVFATYNLVWETAQLPLYTIWWTGTLPAIAFAVIHCTAGDVLIGVTALLVSAIFTRSSATATQLYFLPIAISYTVFSEWFNVHYLKTWAYTDLMPIIPPFGTGLSPLLQWIVVPTLTWFTARTAVRDLITDQQYPE